MTSWTTIATAASSLKPFWLVSAAAFLTTVLLVPLAGALARRAGVVARPRMDRWGRRPTPLWGGLAIFAGYAIPLFWVLPSGHRAWGIVAAGAAALALGAYDDKVNLKPQTKLIGQLLTVCLLVALGFGFKLKPAGIFSILASVAWGVLVMNALNLIDNMDGLSPGVSLVAVVFVGVFLWRADKPEEAALAASLAGALAGFLLFNFPPAKIYMGDAGSLSLGLTLAGLTLSTSLYADQKLSALSVLLGPTLVLAIPLLDVVLVSITRILAGRPISQGGRDHTSHRLVELGFSERGTVLLLYGLSAVSGLGAVAVTQRGSRLFNLCLVALLIMGLGLFFSYLARLRLSTSDDAPRQPSRTAVIIGLAFKRRLLEILLDVALAFSCFLSAYLFRFDLTLPAMYRHQVMSSLPWILGTAVAGFHAAGLYKGLWSHQGLRDVGRFLKAAGLAAAAGWSVALVLGRLDDIPLSIFPLYGVLLFLGVAATRNSFRFLELLLMRRNHRTPVVILGTGREGNIAFQALSGGRGPWKPVGFLDDVGGESSGLRIHGVPVLGTWDDLESIAARTPFRQIILASDSLTPESREKVLSLARQCGKRVSAFRVLCEDLTGHTVPQEQVAN